RGTPVRSLFNRAPHTDTYTLSLHDALPISGAMPAAREPARSNEQRHRCEDARGTRQRPDGVGRERPEERRLVAGEERMQQVQRRDRKSTRLNSSHVAISYAVFCLKKKKEAG